MPRETACFLPQVSVTRTLECGQWCAGILRSASNYFSVRQGSQLRGCSY